MSLTRDASELGCFLLPSSLCAARLTPEQFRVYAYLVLHTGDTFPDQSKMADACMITVTEARAAGAVLKARGMLQTINATGFPTRYHLTPPSKWLPPEREEKPLPTAGHTEFIKLWTDEYPATHGGDKYKFNGAKDGNAVKALLISSEMTPEDLMKVAREAWKHLDWFHCAKATDLAQFNSNFNVIRNELKNPPNARHTAASKTDRNTGTNNDGRANSFKGVGRVQTELPDVRRPSAGDVVR